MMSRVWCTLLLVVAAALISCCRAALCEVRESVPVNQHMCYHVRGEVEEIEIRDIPRRKWVLEEPANCKSPFPCFGVVTEVVEVEQIPVTLNICQLEPLWRRPRRIQETYDGVTLILSPGYFQERKLSEQLLCIWNVTCPTGHTLFVNFTSIRLNIDGCGSEECTGEYVEVQWEGGRDVRCAEQQGPWLKNHVFSHNIKVTYRSHKGGSAGTGLRLDTVCYVTASARQEEEKNCSSHILDQDHMRLELSPIEEQQLKKALSLHFDLHMLKDACSRGVRECGVYYNHHQKLTLTSALEEIASASATCSPLLDSLLLRTLHMYDYHHT